MFFKARLRWRYWKFDRAIRGILDTAPMPVVPGPCTVVSMVAPRDVRMYLVSMKAFYRRVGGGRIIAIVEPTVPRASRALIARHFPGIEFLPLEQIDPGACQRGGTWERLVHILRLTERGEYVVQMDCDVLAAAPDIDELVRCIHSRTAFTMADDAAIVPVAEAAAFARSLTCAYIGNTVEGLMEQLPGAESLLYVRGSSGLAGFAPGGFPLSRLEAFHREMEQLVGHDGWRGWGTEQCASNFVVANTPGAVVLPHPEYASFQPSVDRTTTKMHHFIGSFRFDKGRFAELARGEIAAIKGSAAPRPA